jgi:hypothetical protein
VQRQEDIMSDQAAVTREALTPDASLVGTLATWPLADLLLWMHQSGRSAMIRIGSGLDAGVVFFVGGSIFRCEWGAAKGEQALIALLALKDGAFTIIQRLFPDVHPNVSRPTAELLLQCAIALDEGRRPTVA